MNIPPMKVVFSLEDRHEILARIDKCLESGQVQQGSNLEEFEAAFAGYVGCRFAIATSNGGSALDVGVRALGLKPGQKVLVPTNTFFATASCVLMAGGLLKLVDISMETLSPTVESLEAAFDGDVVGAIVVHIGGLISRDLKQIKAWCDSKGIWLLEDCAHAHGSRLDGQHAGTFGAGGTFSFFSTKVITSGEGGMFVTNNERLAEQARLLRNYGKPQPWVTISTQVGSNWRLNELAAAVGIVQLKRLDDFITSRSTAAAFYDEMLKTWDNIKVVTPAGRSSWYKYPIVLEPVVDRESLRRELHVAGVALSGGIYDLPLHRQPVLSDRDWGHFPSADAFCKGHICLPLYHGMQKNEAEYVIDTLGRFLKVSR